MQATEQPTTACTVPMEDSRPSPAVTLDPSQRIHYLDNLRALAMLLGVFLHGALAYANPAQSIWLATDTRSSVAIDATIWFIHLFRMGLFFLLSGYFAKLIIERKGLRRFWWNRCLRIALPFALFYPFLLASMTVVIIFAIAYLDAPEGLMKVIASAAESEQGARTPELPGTMHLWFLYYLMAFSIIGALLNYAVRRGMKLPRFSIPPSARWLLLCPLLLVPGAFAGGTPLPAPESFLFQGWPFAFYGLYYFAGWRLFGHERLLERLRPFAWHIALLSCLLFVPYYWLMPELNLSMILEGTAVPQTFWQRGVEACLTAYLSVLLTLASLLLGQIYLSSKSSWLRFISDASYWIYLVHLPLAMFMQTLLVPLEWPIGAKFLTVLMGTLLPSLATYVVFVRYTPIGWMLNGKRAFP